jgi:hypothetical protein
MSTPTNIEAIKSLLDQVNSSGSLVIEGEGDESTRKKLIVAAEKLIIAARTPGENLYMTTAQVYILCPLSKNPLTNALTALSQWINRCCLRLGML